MHLVCPACGAKNRVPEDRLHDGAKCGKCAAALLAGEPVALTDAALPGFVAGTELPVVIDFWAAWCGPCRTMAPHFAAAARQLPDVHFVKVDSDAAPQASAQYGIRSIPTLILFDQGREVARRSGVVPSGELVAWIASHVGASR
ncbi:MAG: thioredoxin TrxC [Ideonella sp.]|nr:thioredoxin TrxC [Ideonella sp.]